MKRFLCLILSLCMIFTCMVVARAATVDTSTASADYILADSIQNGQILQCWNWSFDNISKNMELIAEQGFTAIQTSPVQPSKESTKQSWSTAGNSMWVYYQPIGFTIEQNTRSALGTKADFVKMCETAHKYGVKVIVDTVFNHLANENAENTINSQIPSDIKNDTNCWHSVDTNISNYSDRYDITHHCLGGLPDLNTGSTKVQNYAIDFMKECIDAGADGFRFDAAKHIETPSDSSSVASDFWPNVLGAATSYAQSSRGITPYYYGELLDSPGGSLSISAYTQYMSVTDNQGSNSIRNSVVNGSASGACKSSISNGASTSKTVQWNESHDTYNEGSSSSVSDANLKKTWAIVGTRAKVCGMYLARPSSSSTKLGAADITAWADKEVKEINKFKNTFVGESEYFAYSGSTVYVERGTKGVVLVNVSGGSKSVSVTANRMASGTYTDAISGNTFTVSGGKITGNIGSSGIAVVYNQSDVEEPTEVQTQAPTDEPTDSTATDPSVPPTDPPTEPTEPETEPETDEPTEPDIDRTVYCVNSKQWDELYAHAWSTTACTTWPGILMSKTTDTVNGFDVYEITFDINFENMVFHNNAGVVTENLVFEHGKYFDLATSAWYASLDEVPVYVPTEPETEQPTAEPTEEPTHSTDAPTELSKPAGYYLVGELNGADCWTVDSLTEDRRFVKKDLDGNYVLDYTFYMGDELKVAYFDGYEITRFFKGIEDSDQENYKIGVESKTGLCTVTFNPEGGDWSYTYFTVRQKIVEGQCGDNVYYALDKNGLLSINGSGDMYEYSMITSPWSYNKDIKSVAIADGITNITNNVFAYCDSLTSVTIPDSVNSIGYYAFCACSKLTSVTILNAQCEIGVYAIPTNATIYGYQYSTAHLYAAEYGNKFVALDVEVPTEPETEAPTQEPTEAPTQAPTAKPEKVENVTYTSTANTVKLTWDNVDSCFKYWIYKYNEKTGEWAIAASTRENSGVVKNLDPNTSYKFKVIGKFLADYSVMDINKADEYGAVTAKPLTPDSVVSTSTLKETTISWDAVEGATKYWVYKSSSPDGPFYICYSTPETSAVISKLNNDRTYYFKVATYTVQNGIPYISDIADSPTAVVETKKSAEITTVIESYTGETVTVSWPELNVADKYWVIYSTDGENWTSGGSTTTDTTLTLKKMEPNTVYSVTIRARYVDESGVVQTYDYIPATVRTAYSEDEFITFTKYTDYVGLAWPDDITDVTKTWIYIYDEGGNQVNMASTTTNSVLIKKFDGFENCYYVLRILDTNGNYAYLTPTGGEKYHN